MRPRDHSTFANAVPNANRGACSTNLVIILAVMQISKKIPFEDPFTLNLCRGAYALSNIIILGIYLYIQTVVNKKKGTHAIIGPFMRWGPTPANTRAQT